MSIKTEQLEWRRNKVIELRSRGLSQTEIANELKISKQLVNIDMRYLRSQAKENIKQYITEHLPEQYQICLHALDTVIRYAFSIMESTEIFHEKLTALELFSDSHIRKLELLSDSQTIDFALNFIKTKQSQYQQQENKGQKQDQVSSVEGSNSNAEEKNNRDENADDAGASIQRETETEKQTEVS